MDPICHTPYPACLEAEACFILGLRCVCVGGGGGKEVDLCWVWLRMCAILSVFVFAIIVTRCFALRDVEVN